MQYRKATEQAVNHDIGHTLVSNLVGVRLIESMTHSLKNGPYQCKSRL